MKNDRFLRALRRQPVDRTPIWIMRQAGRYLPEYRQTRQRAGDFLSLCKNTELACEVTLQPLARFELDAAILFSDILTIPDAMGLGLYFAEGEGPRFERPVRDEASIDALSSAVMDELVYVTDAVALIRKELRDSVPLIGFTGSPWTLATYMVEGGPTRDFAQVKRMLYQAPQLLHRLLTTLSDAICEYLCAQVDAGAQALQIFDTWGGVLSEAAYREFSLDYMSKIVAKVAAHPAAADVPVIVFTKGGGQWLDAIAGSGCQAVGLDWTIDIGRARAQLDDRVTLQGNLDPAILRAAPKVVEQAAADVLAAFGQHTECSGHVFNLGHGITPDIDPDTVLALVETVHRVSPAYHR